MIEILYTVDDDDEKKDTLIGQKYGRLTIVEDLGYSNRIRLVRCICECSNERIERLLNLKYSIVKSCGCLKREYLIERITTHGLSKTKLYKVWSSMKSRCYNTNNERYNDYGGRGIIVCDEWKNSFEAFHEWAIINGYVEKLTIERMNNDKGYDSSNCRWATIKEQSRNKRSNVFINYEDKKISLMELSEITNINRSILLNRYHANGEKDLLRKVKKRKRIIIQYKGETDTLMNLCTKYNKNYKKIHHMLSNGLTVNEAFEN